MKVGSPIAKNHSFKPHASLVIMVFIGLRDAYYIKLVSGRQQQSGCCRSERHSQFRASCLQFCVNNGLYTWISLVLNFLSAELLARLPLEMFYRLGNINISSADVCLFETLIQ